MSAMDCPRCGSKNEAVIFDESDHNDTGAIFSVRCIMCGCEFELIYTFFGVREIS